MQTDNEKRISKLLAMSFGMKKLSKVNMYAIIKEKIIPKVDDMEAEYLLKYFMPIPPSNPKTPFDWVARGISKDQCREVINYVFVDEESMVGTDGSVMHYAPANGMAPGFYNANGDQVDCKQTYPAYKNVIPHNKLVGELDLNDVVTGGDPTCKGDYYINFNGVHLNYVRVLNAMCKEDKLAIEYGDAYSPVILRHPLGRAVIMPMRHDS